MLIGLPSILIPLPISYLDEQTQNAKIAEKWGIATIIPQEKLTPEKLMNTIDKTISNIDVITSRVKNKKSPDYDASARLVKVIDEYMK
jgi:UDP-N-acetylglucosamine:LPS N-acetylglucosamine transferase